MVLTIYGRKSPFEREGDELSKIKKNLEELKKPSVFIKHKKISGVTKTM